MKECTRCSSIERSAAICRLILLLAAYIAQPVVAQPAEPVAFSWFRLANLPQTEGLAGAFAGACGDSLIVAGGTNFVDQYAAKPGAKTWYDAIYVLAEPNGAWVREMRLPRPLAYGASTATPEGLLLIGGCDEKGNTADVLRLRCHQESVVIEAYPSLPQPASFVCAALVGRNVYVAGGLSTPNLMEAPSLHTFWVLNLDDVGAGWRALPAWPGPERFYAVAATDERSFFLLSGLRRKTLGDGTHELEYLSDAYRYDPDQSGGSWSVLSHLPHANAAAASPAPVVDGRYIAILGRGADGSHRELPARQHPGFGSGILIYDIADDRWHVGGHVPAARAAITAAAWRDMVVLPSGESHPGLRSPLVYAVRLSSRGSDR